MVPHLDLFRNVKLDKDDTIHGQDEFKVSWILLARDETTIAIDKVVSQPLKGCVGITDPVEPMVNLTN
jgi:hypothetical protein